jgi:hypothetical protein
MHDKKIIIQMTRSSLVTFKSEVFVPQQL